MFTGDNIFIIEIVLQYYENAFLYERLLDK